MNTIPPQQDSAGQSISPGALAIYALFFLSGFCGLVYEIIWMRRFAVGFGNTTYAITVVLAAFMAGLAAGSKLFGRLADSPRRTNSLLTYYGWMEIAIGVYCLAFDSLLGVQRSLMLLAYGAVDPTGVLSLLIKFLISALLLIVPTLLMGGTLPVLIKALSRRLPEVGKVTGRLYFINCTGAVAGTLAAAFWMIPSLGLPFSTAVAAAINILVGLAALGMRGRLDEPVYGEALAASTSADTPPGEPLSGRVITLALAGIFVSGFTAMVYEISWTRILSMVLGSSTYSFALMLAAFITGIALGGLLISAFMDRIANPARAFAVLQGVVALSVLAMLPLYSRLPLFFLTVRELIAFSYETHEAFKFLVCLLVMIVPATAFGMGFPLVARLAADRMSEVAGKVGGVYALNTLGNIGGSVLCGLAMIPLLGIKLTIEIAVLLNLATCLSILAALGGRRRLAVVSYALSAGAVLVYFLLAPGWDRHLLTGGAFRYHSVSPGATAENFYRSAHEREFVYYREGISTTVSVERDGEALMLRVNGKVDASNEFDMSTQYLLAHLPMLLHPDPSRILVIGAGSGATCGAALSHQSLERLVCVEISPGVAEASRYFDAINHRYWEDPRVELVIDDGRNFLFRDDSPWDVITSEPSNPWIAGIGNLYTEQFYADCARRLAPGGLICQWIHLYEMDEIVLKTILTTFTRTFPHAVAFSSVENSDLLLIGSARPLETDFEAISRRMGQPEVAEDLKRIGISSLFTLLATQVFNERGMRRWSGIAPVNSDDFPIVEYSAPRGFFYASHVELPSEYRLAGADNLLARYLAGHRATADELVETARYQMVSSGMTYLVFSTLADALEREPDHREGLALKVELLTERRKYAEAVQVLERYRAVESDEKKLLEMEFPLATALAQRHSASLLDKPDFSRALEIKRRLIELEPSRGIHYYGLGETFRSARQWSSAAAAFETALENDAGTEESGLPEVPLVLHRIGECWISAGQLDRAEAVYVRLLREYPANPLWASMLQLIAYQRLLEEPGTPDPERIRQLFGN
ncbi:MAG: tetratricopeptide repeat protein [Candidatus Glassbacteria bacterium]|nr:tetratricopeptide repeat protein [Candidatus Glassbacteria bacterium]